MNVFVIVIVSIFANAFFGAVVCATLDTEDKIFYEWYAKPLPFHGVFCFLVLSLWPVMAYFMIKYRIERGKMKTIKVSNALYESMKERGLCEDVEVDELFCSRDEFYDDEYEPESIPGFDIVFKRPEPKITGEAYWLSDEAKNFMMNDTSLLELIDRDNYYFYLYNGDVPTDINNAIARYKEQRPMYCTRANSSKDHIQGELNYPCQYGKCTWMLLIGPYLAFVNEVSDEPERSGEPGFMYMWNARLQENTMNGLSFYLSC